MERGGASYRILVRTRRLGPADKPSLFSMPRMSGLSSEPAGSRWHDSDTRIRLISFIQLAEGATSDEVAMRQPDLFRTTKKPWNAGRIIGPKSPLKPKHIWAIRQQLKVSGRRRDLAMFNCAIDAKLRACDLVRLTAWDVAPSDVLRARSTVECPIPGPIPMTAIGATETSQWDSHDASRPVLPMRAAQRQIDAGNSASWAVAWRSRSLCLRAKVSRYSWASMSLKKGEAGASRRIAASTSSRDARKNSFR